MDTEKISALLRALELGSLSAAAEALGYTPSGMSRMMASLEAEAGFSLLIRSREGLRPTRECEQLLPHFRALAEEATRTAAVTDALRGVESGEVYVGTPYPVFFRKLSRLIAAFSSRFPGIHIGLLEGMSSELAAQVERRKADFCIISRREGDFSWTPLLDDSLVALVPKGHPLVQRGCVTPQDISNEPFIMMHPDADSDCLRYLNQNRIAPHIRFSSRDTYAAYHMVEAGLGITLDNAIFAAHHQSPAVCALPLAPAHHITIGIATPHRENLSPAAMRFFEMAQPYFPPYQQADAAY